MPRQIWVLLGWSPELGASVTPVGVLGLDPVRPESLVEWIPREYVAGQIWRERLTGVDAATLADRMALWAETPIAPAARVEAAEGTLGDVVRAQVDDLLGSAR
ncbi:hypothetical protein Q5425_32075 [Amycolatopsis sp. A133]|uniref:hypothetical protein n=1 Tax=Amycolatopsis sp. A133 TaxID=3064472 RepID=UPI0027F5B046|nr:hypothetical protein [Amycolatopsis sp. A133]MDQ7808396.1 hypothetical protein [Amycolatopsis sp. A133]